MARRGSEGDTGRGLVFVLVLAAIVVGPVQMRWLGGPQVGLDGWSMYQDLGVGLLDARFVQRTAAGDEIDLDPRVVLRSEPRPISRKLRGPAELAALARRLCVALGADTDVRAYARMATLAGWSVAASGEHNLCMPPGGA
jgi:hypothetical protein